MHEGLAMHWYVIGISILLVTGLSFINFLALPHAAVIPHQTSPLLHPRILAGAALHSEPVASAALTSPPLDRRLDFYGQPVGEPGGVKGNAAAGGAAPAQREAAALRGAGATAAPALGEAAAAVAQRRPAPRETATSKVVAAAAASDFVHVPPKEGPRIAFKGGIAALNGESWLRLAQAVDNAEVTLGVWIFLPHVLLASFPPSSSSMKTVAATKESGCKKNDNTQGWALFVHEWGTTNRQLRLSWTTSAGACHELFSKTSLVPYNTWVHVGFSLSKNDDRGMIFLDGQVIADTRSEIGSYTSFGQVLPLQQASVASRLVLHGGSLFIGGHRPQQSDSAGGQSHLFMGFLGDLRLVHATFGNSPEMLRALMASESELRTLVPVAAVTVALHFAVGEMPPSVIDCAVLGHGTGRTNHVKVVRWQEQPSYPTAAAAHAEGGAADAGHSTTPSPPGMTLSPAALRATWPQAWTDRFSEDVLVQSQEEAYGWADEVRDAMRHTWRGYKAKAWGRDDIKPDSGNVKDWCRMAVTMLDGLSTLWVMGLHAEFDEAAAWIEKQNMPEHGKHGMHSLFEINIRALGGLLSAYSLSNRTMFLDTARRLGDVLLPAFRTASGIPKSTVDVGTGDSQWHSWVQKAVLAEVTTVQVEFRYLSHVTGDNKYAQASDKAMDAVLKAGRGKGLVPIYLSREGEALQFLGSKISFGAMGDSYYEYLLKQWLQSGRKEDRLKDTWKVAMKEMVEQLVVKTAGGHTFIAEKDNDRQLPRMDHLACFVAGMLMLGSHTLPKEEVNPQWETLAAEITETCNDMYKRSPTGLSAEYYQFITGSKDNDMVIPQNAPHNLLRPEALEAMYYMHYYTGDPKYRRMAYEVFKAFNRHCKAAWGYSAVADVRVQPPRHRDSQESFWLAETLKYLYLIFAPRSTLNLEEFLLNTEAQPLRMWA